jgi:hypothetical protein
MIFFGGGINIASIVSLVFKNQVDVLAAVAYSLVVVRPLII